ncbi:DeoR/GlpR family DNA-binding transcription regulator [Litoreibacter roseus]|uniref:DeoR family transcriptional regulator n=1 Tax=Litoreibacter roseus TaxID=2601869 RepID=A0A6N6JAU0_9RHOB|nr:DeoR/GlpR family DNA-binding transcription regulator [Litoreibacter roseus]GFE62990.1 DeoR family transcriptional regulator [Litoreibacter roseus]
MVENLRQSEILNIARKDGRVTVDQLSRLFQTSAQTIRKDLTDLAEGGQLKRVHGGAILPSGVSNIEYEDRSKLNRDAKADIARACAEDIADGASLFLNIGTSTEAVARALLNHRSLMVVTNNLNIANILSANPGCEVMVAGGVLRRSDGGLVGALTTQMIRQFKFDIAVIGCSALDSDGDILDFDLQEVGVSRAIIEQARRTFLVADHSKFDRTAPVRIASMSEVDAFYTDALPPNPLGAKLRDWGTAIRTV